LVDGIEDGNVSGRSAENLMHSGSVCLDFLAGNERSPGVDVEGINRVCQGDRFGWSNINAIDGRKIDDLRKLPIELRILLGGRRRIG
jgi:hypothetical protein